MASHMPALMVASEHEHLVGVIDFHADHKEDNFNRK